MQLSVITATCRRPAWLVHALSQFRQQSLSGLRCEHLIVSDGPDPETRSLADHWGARYIETPHQGGAAGAAAKSWGIQHARGKYLCFWDDDNVYAPHALATLYAAAYGVDLGVVRVQHRLRKHLGMATLPRRWSGQFRAGDIDTMCVCVRRELALKERWDDGRPPPGTDYRWLQKLQGHAPSIRYVPVIVGVHA